MTRSVASFRVTCWDAKSIIAADLFGGRRGEPKALPFG
jgi:hypothetical protein